MAVLLNKGTIEFVKVVIVDRNDTTAVTDLSTHTPQFKVTSLDELTDIIAWTNANSVDLMTLYCLIDTTIAGFVIGTSYKFFTKFTVTPETPVLGPELIKIQ